MRGTSLVSMLAAAFTAISCHADEASDRLADELFPDAYQHPTRDFIEANSKAMVESMQQVQQASQQFDSDIAEARKRFWTSYPHGATHANDAAELAKLLFAKDYYYLVLECMPETDKPGLNLLTAGSINIDGGIPSSARHEWILWIKNIKDRLNNEHIDLTEIVPKILEAVADSAPDYGRYVVARDWAEIDAGRVKLAPADYAFMLVQRYPHVKTGIEALEDYKSMLALFGDDVLNQTAGQVQDLAVYDGDSGYHIPTTSLDKLGIFTAEWDFRHPLTQSPQLTPAPAGTTAVQSQDNRARPFDVWMTLLGKSGGRGYLATEIARANWDGPNSEYTPRLPWAGSITEVDRLISCYGSAAVIAATDKVRAATQSQMPRYVIGTDLGLSSSSDATAVMKLLARGDAEGFARLIVAEHNMNPKDVPADLSSLETTYGKDKIVTAAAAVAQTMISNNSYTSLGAKDDDAYEGLLACLVTHVPNDPYYIAWSKWPVGSRAIYHHLDLHYNGKTILTDEDVALVLSAVSPQTVTLIRTVRDSRHPDVYTRTFTVQISAWHEPDAHGQVLTDMHPTEYLYSNIPFQKADIGPDETLQLAGQALVCHQRINRLSTESIFQLFTSDEVPGMLVDEVHREHNSSYSIDNLHLFAFQRGDGTASTGAFTEWPADIAQTPEPNIPEAPGIPEPTPALQPNRTPSFSSSANAPSPSSIPGPSPSQTNMTQLQRLTGKTTGSIDSDARIIRALNNPGNERLPASIRTAIKRGMLSVLHYPGNLSPAQVKSLLYDCARLERGLARINNQ